MEILEELLKLKDDTYAAFQRKLLPTVDPDTVIGVRTPELKALAKKIYKSGDSDTFLTRLPHVYFEENQLHAFLLCEEKDFSACITKTEAFLAYIDNWATCDQLSPKVFAKQPERLLEPIENWIGSPLPYTVRFGIGMLMRYFLDERFSSDYPARVAAVVSDEYYVNMMAAWYFATALAKQYHAVVPYLEQKRLPPWTHRKAIQKACESCRIAPEQKSYLKTLI